MTDRCQARDELDVRCRWPHHLGNVHNFSDGDPAKAYRSPRPGPVPTRPDPGVYDCCGSAARFGHPRICWPQWQYLRITAVGMALMVGMLVWFVVVVTTR